MRVTLSIRSTPNLSKDERSEFNYYTNFVECEFADLRYLLSKDYIFNPFNYLGYRQASTNICSQATFVVIDVDSTSIPMNERFDQLIAENLQCIIATTSNPFNWHKYRILLPISRTVSAEEYRALVTGIAQFGLVSDMDPVSAKPAQKFYSYAGSAVLFSFTGQPLGVDDYLADISIPTYTATSPPTDVIELLPNFTSYSQAIKGKRTRSLISAGYKSIELGMTDEQVEHVIMYVNSLFLVPKPYKEVKRRVLDFIKTRRSL